MASSSAPVHPYRYLTLFLVLLIGAYLLVFLTGDKQAEPKLGIDLQGGTRVTLTARTPDGSQPTREALLQAQEIISSRVDGLGVSGSEVVIDGDNLVITVPGNDGNEARNLGQTARLYIRPVIHAIPAAGQEPRGSAGRRAGVPGAPPGVPGGRLACRVPGSPPGMPPPDRARRTRRADRAAQPGAAGPRRRRLAPQPRPHPSRGPTGAGADPRADAGPARHRAGAPPAPGSPAPAGSRHAGTPNPRADLAQRISDEKALRQSADQQIQLLALQFQATRCNDEDVLAGNDDPNLPLVTCSQDHKEVYLLDKSIISGEQIESASSGLDQQRGEYVVDLRVQERGFRHLGRLHRGQRRHADRVHPRLAGGQRPADQRGDPRWPHPDHRAASPRTPPASSPTCSSTARCRCRSSRRKPKPSRRHWV